MFVTEGARALLINEHRTTFSENFITPLLAEANRLGLGSKDVIALIEERSQELHLTTAIDPTTTEPTALDPTAAKG
jgi:GntR family transcriptional regulator